MSCAPLKGDGGVVRFGPRAAGQRRLLCTNNLCLSPSYARHATPTVHSLSPRRSAGTAPREFSFAKLYSTVWIFRPRLPALQEALRLPARLDAIDRKILKELQDDGRITNV